MMQTQKARSKERAFYDYAGDHLISHTISRAVPSAQRDLTSVFGSVLVETPDSGKIQHETCDRSGTGDFVCCLGADCLAWHINQNITAVWIDQPAQFCAIGNPGLHLLFG